MVLQRLQSLLLFFSFALMLVFCLVPFASLTASGPDASVYPTAYPTVLYTGIAATAMIFITIFMFKNLGAQKALVWVDMLVTAGAGVAAVCCATTETSTVNLTGGVTLAAIAFLLEIFALTRINRDARLLRESRSSRLR